MKKSTSLTLRDWFALLALAITLVSLGLASYLRIDRQLSELRVSQAFTLEDVREITKDIKSINHRLMERKIWTVSH